ncbi:MAG: ABC transporter permease [Rhodoglobus sp.]
MTSSVSNADRGLAARGRAPSRARFSFSTGTPQSSRSRWDGISWLRVAAWLFCIGVIATPLSAIVLQAFSGNHLPLLLHGDVLEAGFNSLVSAGLSAAGAVALGLALALLLDRTDLPGARVLRLFMLTPLLVPPFVGAIAWLGIAGPAGPVNRFWSETFGAPLWNIYGGDGVVFLLIVHSYPIAYLIIGAALRRIPSDLEQLARIGGAGAWTAVRHVTIPLLKPALLSAFTLTLVSNLADFGIPSIIGLPERYVTLSTLVYRYIQSGTVDAPLEVVSTIGLLLLVLAAIAVIADNLVSRRKLELESGATVAVPLRLGRAKPATTIIAWTVGLSLTALPIFALTTQALLPAPGVPLTWENLTLESFRRALASSSTATGAINSIVLSLAAGIICAVVGLTIGTLITRLRSRDNVFLNGIALLPQAIPGLVLAVGWLIIAPQLGLFNTPWLILCAYVMAFLAMVVQSVNAPLRSTPLALEEAARLAGASRARALFDISWRLAAPAAITGGVLVMLTAVRELTISVLLVAPGTQTIGVLIFNLQQAGAYNAASALSLIITIIGLTGLGLTARGIRA